jgi:uncharacterized Zn-finger protein
LPKTAFPDKTLSMVDSFEKIPTTTRKVFCDGGGGALGHPRVFLNIADGDHIVCPYCSRTFVLDKHAAQHDAH